MEKKGSSLRTFLLGLVLLLQFFAAPPVEGLFSNLPSANIKLFGYWEGYEIIGNQRSETWTFSFGIAIEKNVIQIQSPNISWTVEYTTNDATDLTSIDVIFPAGQDNRQESQTSYGLISFTEYSFTLALAKPGFPYRPVQMKGDSIVRVWSARKLNKPEQVHLAYGKDPQTEITVSWVTTYGTPRTVVQYGLASGRYRNESTGDWNMYGFKKYLSGAIHTVFITGLQPDTKYYYRCGSDNEWSQEYSFKTAPIKPETVVVAYGDLNLGGIIGGSTRTYDESISTLHYIQALEPQSDFLLNVGDISYCDTISNCWDLTLKYMQSMVANKPMMVCQGNHDVDPEPYSYRNRFFMPSIDTSEDARSYFYSFDVGPIHFIGISTELWFLPFNTTMTVARQMDWLRKDLVLANEPSNRSQRPWIVVFGHRPLYCTAAYSDCSNHVAATLQDNLDPLFNKYGVNLFIGGHIHSMERTYPISTNGQVSGTYAKPEGTVHVGVGMAGQGFLGPWEPGTPPPWNGWRDHVHGYSRITANLDKLKFSFVSNTGYEIDTFVLGQPWTGTSNPLSP